MFPYSISSIYSHVCADTIFHYVISGTGVAFSRNPSTGENVMYGEYLINAQGEDVVAGKSFHSQIFRHE